MDDTRDFFDINEQISDNKCYVLIIYDIEDVVRIRTGERGIKAV